MTSPKNLKAEKQQDYNVTLENLVKLRNYWQNNYKHLTLEMDDYGGICSVPKETVEKRATKDYTVNICNTPCCLLGSCVAVIPIDFKKDFGNRVGAKIQHFNYPLYGRRIFPSLYTADDDETDTWRFLFYSLWEDNIQLAMDKLNIVIDLGIGLTGARYLEELAKINDYPNEGYVTYSTGYFNSYYSLKYPNNTLK